MRSTNDTNRRVCDRAGGRHPSSAQVVFQAQRHAVLQRGVDQRGELKIIAAILEQPVIDEALLAFIARRKGSFTDSNV
jgi:hypothetical protein